MTATSESFRRTLWRDGSASDGARRLAEETAVAISYNGSTHAVLMATPADLEDLAVGFSLTEGIVDDVRLIEAISVVEFDLGLDVQVRVHDSVADRLAKRRRTMAGPVGCGLCGLDSLEAASRDLPLVRASTRFTPDGIALAARTLEDHQILNRATGSAHAAGFFVSGEPVLFAREDVGRHNALDKLIGAVLRRGLAARDGGFVVTSRVSVELIQKTAVAGCGLLAAISAPTALAVRSARDTNITLAAVVRGSSFEIFTGPERIAAEVVAHVA
ncbi:MAG TPA: formate dehydrogenase accessory sulfurtransferase FdhD [Hyphomicrobiaceae bacterium]|nr:formate dehydrogenase accessory sulfurtransferase FdhD [Hyphomicrobiaceae bacterium]